MAKGGILPPRAVGDAAGSSQHAALLQPAGGRPPDITVSVHPANGGLANSSHLGDGSESEAGNGAGGAADLATGLSWGRGGEPRGGGGVRAAFAKLFSRGHDMEAAGVNHAYTGDERARLKQFQSIDYLAPSSRVYRAWLAAQPYGRYWDRWLMMALIGVAVGLVGFSLHTLVHLLASAKYHGTRCAAPRCARRALCCRLAAPPLLRRHCSCRAAQWRFPRLVGAAWSQTLSFLPGCTCMLKPPLRSLARVLPALQLAAVAHARGGGLDVQHHLLAGPGLHLHLAGRQRSPRGGC